MAALWPCVSAWIVSGRMSESFSEMKSRMVCPSHEPQEIAGFQLVHHFGDRAQLEPTPGNMHRLLGRLSIRCKQRPPGLGYEG
jgi:hypothetical protein